VKEVAGLGLRELGEAIAASPAWWVRPLIGSGGEGA